MALLLVGRHFYQSSAQMAAAELEHYLQVNTLISGVEAGVHQSVFGPSRQARDLASRLPTVGSPYFAALKGVASNDFSAARRILTEGIESGELAQDKKVCMLLGRIDTYTGEYSRALYWYRRSLEDSASLDDIAELTLSFFRAGRLTAAEALASSLLTFQETVYGNDIRRLLPSRLALANVYNGLGRYREALHVLDSACKEVVNVPAGSPIDEAACNMMRAEVLASMGRFGEAETALQHVRSGLGPITQESAEAHARAARLLGSVYLDSGQLDLAESVYADAMRILEGHAVTKHPYIALLLNDFGDLRLEQAQYDEAELSYERALALQEQLVHPLPGDVLVTRHNLGRLAWIRDEYVEAERLYQNVLRSWRALGNETAAKDYGIVLLNLALLYDDMSRSDDARELHAEAIQVLEISVGSSHPDLATAMNNFASHLSVNGEHAEALEMSQKALAILRRAFGSDHPEVATVLNSIGAQYHRAEEFEAAEETYLEALAIRRVVLGNEHPDVAIVLNNIARAREGRGDLRGADEAFSEACRIAEVSLRQGERKGLIAILQNYLGFLQAHRPGQAHMIQKRIDGISSAMSPPGT